MPTESRALVDSEIMFKSTARVFCPAVTLTTALHAASVSHEVMPAGEVSIRESLAIEYTLEIDPYEHYLPRPVARAACEWVVSGGMVASAFSRADASTSPPGDSTIHIDLDAWN